MKVSVAIATCDGEQFVETQLASILAQTRLPDELVLVDDASTDRTVALASSILRRPPFETRVERNTMRLGPAGNFNRALSMTTGDVVLLADQDDVWMPERVARTTAEFATAQNALAVFGDGALVDDEGRPLPGTLWKRVGLDRPPDQFELLGELVRSNVVTGAALAVSRKLLEIALPIPAAVPHDHWLALLAAALGGLQPLPEPLIEYRLHGRNLVGLPAARLPALIRARMAKAEVRRTEVTLYNSLLARLAAAGVEADAVGQLEEKHRHARFRAQLPPSPPARLIAVARSWNTGSYRRFTSRPVLSAVLDLVGRS